MERPSPTRQHTRRAAAAAVSWTLLGIVLGGIGCATLPVPGLRRQEPTISQSELREKLINFASRFEAVVATAGDRIRAETVDPEIRRRVLLWEIRLVPLVQEAAFVSDPQAAFIAVNSVVVMMRRYFTEGDGAQVFGASQPIAVEAARELEEDFYAMATSWLSPQEVARLRTEVSAYDRGRVISGSDFTVAGVRRQVEQVRESGRFDFLLSVPLSPFRALEGVGSGAAAISDFNDTAIRFARIVEGLPKQLRWQSELLLYDVESRESLIGALAALDSFTESARQLAAVAQRLPTDLDAVLGDSEGALGEVNRALQTAHEMVEPLRLTAEQVNLAGASWGALVTRDGEHDPDARPFDILEYEAAARGIGEAATELRGLALELDALLESHGVEATFGGVDSAVSHAEVGLRSVVDHAAWRGFQLLIALFGLLLAYRLVASRLPASVRRPE